MRVVLDARSVNDHFPGIGRYAFNLARALSSLLGQDEEMVLLRDPTRPSRLDVSELAGSRVRVMDVPISVFSPSQQWKLPTLLGHLGADAYHSPYYLMPYWTGVPSLVTIHDLIPLRYPRYYTPFQRLAFGVTVRLAARTARRVIADSRATGIDLQRLLGIPEDRIRVVPAAADPRFRICTSMEVGRVRTKYDLPAGYVLHLSSGKPHKNLTRLVDAWALLVRRGDTSGRVLVLAGQLSPRYPEARERIAALGLESGVRVLGKIPDGDLPALYAGASWFVFPSLYEGFGLPVLEAMACGTPVVCSGTSSLPEIAGDAAITFDPSDTKAIADGLASALADPALREQMREKAVLRAQAFGWERTARMAYQCYEEAVEASGLQ